MSARAVARAAASTPIRGALAVARAALRWPRRSQWASGGLRGASEGEAGCAWRWQGRLSAAAGAESGHGNSTRGSWRGARVRRRACDLRFACDLMAIEWAPCRRTTRRDDGVVAGGGARAGRREVARKRNPHRRPKASAARARTTPTAGVPESTAHRASKTPTRVIARQPQAQLCAVERGAGPTASEPIGRLGPAYFGSPAEKLLVAFQSCSASLLECSTLAPDLGMRILGPKTLEAGF